MKHILLIVKLLLILGIIHHNIIVVADQTCDGDSCKKHTESEVTTCDEDGDEPCFFDDDEEEEDASKPVLLRDSTNSDGYPVFEKLSRPVNIKVCIIWAFPFFPYREWTNFPRGGGGAQYIFQDLHKNEVNIFGGSSQIKRYLISHIIFQWL